MGGRPGVPGKTYLSTSARARRPIGLISARALKNRAVSASDFWPFLLPIAGCAARSPPVRRYPRCYWGNKAVRLIKTGNSDTLVLLSFRTASLISKDVTSATFGRPLV
jgi:hypothetical protein